MVTPTPFLGAKWRWLPGLAVKVTLTRLVLRLGCAALVGVAYPVAQSAPPATPALPEKSAGPVEVPDTTDITAEGSEFHQNIHQAIFLQNVFVKHPQFNLNCDKLTAFLKHQETTVLPGELAPKRKIAAKRQPKASPGEILAPVAENDPKDSMGGIEKAIAEGSVVITQDKLEPDGRVTHSVGHSRKAIYEAESGDITLMGMPECEQTENTCIALAEETIIILNRAGQMRAIGPHRMLIKHMESDSAAVKSASEVDRPISNAKVR